MKVKYAILLSLFALTACQSSPKFQNNEEAVSNLTKVGIYLMDVPNQFGLRTNELQQKFERLVNKQLNDAGIKVIDRQIVTKVYREVKSVTENIYDPNTGKVDNVKLLAAKKETFKRLNKQFNVSHFLYGNVWVDSAPFEHHYAIWDGVHETYLRDYDPVLNTFSNFFIQRSGRIGALTFNTTIVDINNESIYMDEGGLQLVSKLVIEHRDCEEEDVPAVDIDISQLQDCSDAEPVNKAGKKVNWVSNSAYFESIPIENLLTDDTKIENAVSIALKKLKKIKKNGTARRQAKKPKLDF